MEAALKETITTFVELVSISNSKTVDSILARIPLIVKSIIKFEQSDIVVRSKSPTGRCRKMKLGTLFVEMKTKAGVVSGKQSAVGLQLNAKGYRSVIARSAADAIKTIEDYLNG